MAADPIIYCLEQLTDYDQFERLCNDLMAAEGNTAIEPLGGKKDKGRDAINVNRHDSNDVTIFAYSVREDWRKKLQEDAEKIRKHGHTCRRLTFLCTAMFTPTERDEASTFMLDTFGWTLDLYGLERLRILLGVHRSVVSNHPSIFCPPFFPRAGGVTIIESYDYLIIDYADPDEALATWLARRLSLEGYRVWCRSIAPVGGSSLNETLDTLVRHRAFRLLSILSPASLSDPDVSARRTLAAALRPDLLLPILAAPIADHRLDTKTRSLEPVRCDGSLATGLGQLLEVLAAAQCPRASKDAGIALRSFIPSDLILAEPEKIYSNRFRVLSLPTTLKRFTSMQPLEGDEWLAAGLQWAFRSIDAKSFIAFQPPPDMLRDTLSIRPSEEVAWCEHDEISGIPTRNLVPELIKKSLRVACHRRGLACCSDRQVLYFPEGLLKSNLLPFIKPNGKNSRVGVAGTRSFWRPGGSAPYKYHLAPLFYARCIGKESFSVSVRLYVRITDADGKLLPPRTALSRRKHLCKRWWNYEWLNRTLAVMRFLAEGNKITIGESSNDSITIAAVPDSWTVPLRINEAALKDAEKIRDEAVDYLIHDEEAEESDVD